MVVFYVLAVCFAVLAIALFHGQAISLIPRVKRLSESDRARLREKLLCRFMGVQSIVIATGFLMLAQSRVSDKDWLISFGVVLVVLPIYLVAMMPISRFLRKQR